jgi:hypothetical protein
MTLDLIDVRRKIQTLITQLRIYDVMKHEVISEKLSKPSARDIIHLVLGFRKRYTRMPCSYSLNKKN